MNSITQTFRSKLFAGIATLLPLYLTFIVIKFLFVTLEEISDPLLKRFDIDIPGLGIILTVSLIYLLGLVVTNFLGRKIFNIGENFVKRVPIVNMIYTTLKQITETFSSADTAYQKVVLIEYPRKGIYAIGFMTGETKGELKDRKGEMVNVFVPTTPNPTSGFLLFFEKEDIIELDMSVEDAIKLVVSAGMVVPPKK